MSSSLSKPATGEIRPCRRRQLQPFVIVARHLAEQRHVVCRRIQRTRQTWHGGLLLHRLRREHGVAALPQQLEGVPERNAVMVLHELDGVAGFAARHAVEQSLVRRDDEVRFVAVGVERATPDQVFRAVFFQLDAPALDQRPANRSDAWPDPGRLQECARAWVASFRGKGVKSEVVEEVLAFDMPK